MISVLQSKKTTLSKTKAVSDHSFIHSLPHHVFSIVIIQCWMYSKHKTIFYLQFYSCRKMHKNSYIEDEQAAPWVKL